MSREYFKTKLSADDHDKPHCASHEALCELLIGLDKRLGRLELWLIVIVTASLVTAGKITLWPILQKVAGL